MKYKNSGILGHKWVIESVWNAARDHTLVCHVFYHIPCVYVDDSQGPQGGPGLFGQLASDQGHDLLQLGLQLVVVLPQACGAPADGLVHLLRPVDLGDADDHLAWPLLHPVAALLDGVGLGERYGRNDTTYD